MSREIRFSDILYGSVTVPDWLGPFLKIPEFVRLRGIRLSNVDSYEFKDFNGPTRWEHGIAVAGLAARCARRKRLSERHRVTLILAALLHDVATPPFAHTAEYVLDNFDHELETQRVLSAVQSDSFSPDLPVFAAQLPQFRHACRALVRSLGLRVDPDELADDVARMVLGEGDLGYLVCGGIDLDNADNVTRACMYMGIKVDPTVPQRLADWLADQDGPQTAFETSSEPAVQAWLEYRAALYGAFYSSSPEEIGRQAFLQHLMRRALRAGLPRRALVWNTDGGFLTALSTLSEQDLPPWTVTLAELVQRYQLLHEANVLAEIPVDDRDWLRVLRLPQAATWIERKLAGEGFDPFVIVSVRRTSGNSDPAAGMFPPQGVLAVFTLNEEIKYYQLPEWLRCTIPAHVTGKTLRRAVRDRIASSVPGWVHQRPWLELTQEREESITENLQSVGDWSFRLTKNENLHTYPGTFVHAIPATLIGCLGLKGEVVLDPFGGLGQTASEVVKTGGTAISADSNTIVNLAARAKLTFLPATDREYLRNVMTDALLSASPAPPPEMVDRWYHPVTLSELCLLKGYIDAVVTPVRKQFLTACFSAILTDCTGRRGKQHGYFADNTPLPADLDQPPYQNAVDLFTIRVSRNLNILERFYSLLLKNGSDPEEALAHASVYDVDVTAADPVDYGVERNSVAGIITSPPYLCMADYTLGQRLSYGWLAPDKIKPDYACEIGPRRARFSGAKALTQYLEGMRLFAATAAKLLRQDGFLATVLGAPAAKRFQETDVLSCVEEIFEAHGFEHLWTRSRPVQWHRNHGYQRLKEEQITVRTLRRTQ